MTESTTVTAQEFFQAAYEHRYTWDADFTGYRADITVKQANEVYQGQIQINRDLTTEVLGITDETVKQSIEHQLRDIVTHRKRSTFANTHGKNTFTFGATDPSGAVEILVSGDAMGSNYKLRGKEICQVSRVMGPMAFVIDTRSGLDTGKGYVATDYQATFRNSQTNQLIKVVNFQDTYSQVGNYYLLTKQVIRSEENGQMTTTEFTFTNIQLLETALV
jgi:hypothetical protein